MVDRRSERSDHAIYRRRGPRSPERASPLIVVVEFGAAVLETAAEQEQSGRARASGRGRSPERGRSPTPWTTKQKTQMEGSTTKQKEGYAKHGNINLARWSHPKREVAKNYSR